jgi:hypothetical protein
MKLNAHFHLLLKLRLVELYPCFPCVSSCHALKQAYFYIFTIHMGTRIELLSSFQSLRACFGAHPASYPMGTRVLSLEVKLPGCEAHHLPSSHAKVKNEWSYMSIPLCHHAMRRENCTFYLLFMGLQS